MVYVDNLFLVCYSEYVAFVNIKKYEVDMTRNTNITDANNGVMSKREMVAELSKRYNHLPPKTIAEAVDVFFNEISTALVCGDRVELRGFGSMVVRKRESGIARNPKTNQKIYVPDKGALYFRASKDLLRRLNNAHANDNH
jgi:integration host factor subunit beta